MTRDILRIALPSIAQNVTVPLLGLADAAISGHLGGAEYIGAVAVGSMVFNMLYWLCAFLRMSTGGLTAQAVGRDGTAGDESGVWAVLFRALRIGLFISLLLLLVQKPLGDFAFLLMDATPTVEKLARTYFRILIWGAPAVLVTYVLAGWHLGRQDARTPMAVAVVQNIVNILLSLLFVIIFGWKVEGVAAGTLIAQWTGVAMFAFAPLRLKSQRTRLYIYVYRQIRTIRNSSQLQPLKMGGGRVEATLFLRTLCMVAVQVWFTRSGAAQGDTMLAVNALLMQLYLLFSYVMDGFAYAGEALGGKFYGASDRPSFQRLTRELFLWGIGLTAVFSITYMFVGTPLLSALTDNGEVVRAAAPYLPYACLLPLCGVAAFLYDGLCIGTTSTRLMLLSVASGAVTFFSLRTILLPLIAPNDALWVAMLAFLAVRGLVLAALYRRILPQEA